MDHSCGHDRQRPDGLNGRGMNKNWGGKQRIMHPSVIKAEQGYLGKYKSILKPGDTQYMVFLSSDDGPFYMDAAEKDKEQKARKRGNTITHNCKKKKVLDIMAV